MYTKIRKLCFRIFLTAYYTLLATCTSLYSGNIVAKIAALIQPIVETLPLINKGIFSDQLNSAKVFIVVFFIKKKITT